jgi:hypothetical protein
MNTIQRINVDTYKTMNFTLSKNMNNRIYDINYTVTNAIAK